MNKKLRKLIKSPRAFIEDSRRYKAWKAHLQPTKSRRKSIADPVRSPEAFLNLNVIQSIGSQELAGKYLVPDWIRGHGNSLADLLIDAGAPLQRIELFKNADRQSQRARVTKFARTDPDLYRRMLLSILAPVAKEVAGFVFTLDWYPPMRQLVRVCRELEIRTILIPHEGVFASRTMYYCDVRNGADYPICDEAWVWGDLHSQIFQERGYANDRIRIVGSPKLDRSVGYTPSLSRRLFCSLYGLDEGRPIILYAVQPLDSQFDKMAAREAQNRAIRHALSFARANDAQLIVRCPPSGDKILDADLNKEIQRSPQAALDFAPYYLSVPEDAVFHAHVVLSINSTMLFEAVLMNRAAISTKYVEFEQLWSDVGILAAEDEAQLSEGLTRALNGSGRNLTNPNGLAWASNSFSVGSFDGESAHRIRQRFVDTCDGQADCPPRLDFCSHLFEEFASTRPAYGRLGVSPRSLGVLREIGDMLGFRSVISPQDRDDAGSCDVFARWGMSGGESDDGKIVAAETAGSRRLFLAEGFLAGDEYGDAASPPLSIVVDDKGFHWDASRASRLEDRLNSEEVLTAEQLARATSCVALLRESNGVVAGGLHTDSGDETVLLLDQHRSDLTIGAGSEDPSIFERMLQAALRDHPRARILIAGRETIAGADAGWHLGPSVVCKKFVNDGDRVSFATVDQKLGALLHQVQHVYTVASSVAFEALLAGRSVHCFGTPYYSNWGVTADEIKVPRRRRNRTVLEIFHHAYIVGSVYRLPDSPACCNLEDALSHRGFCSTPGTC